MGYAGFVLWWLSALTVTLIRWAAAVRSRRTTPAHDVVGRDVTDPRA